ncbi:MAG: hypothetical protein IT355_18750 [Gemmatimonadaceae bacterium]|nr:hypothetical protein [Gemmatimonadaceae bacterium]
MKPSLAITAVTIALLTACGKKAQDAAPAAAAADAAPPAASAASAAPASPADSTDEQRETAKKQALLDYAAMEDRYMNDAGAQWAAAATASSTFGDDDGKEPASSNLPANAAGPVDEKSWTNNHQDLGMDWLEATFARPVNATAVRVVFENGEGVEAVSKVELQAIDGAWHAVWSGVSEDKADRRGQRTWFVRTFEKTPYQVKAVKLTIANNVQRGYKVVDAVQLVGH